jgi:phosphoglucosamine mutase
MKRRLFGTDGIRGEAGVFPLDQDTVKKVGAALALSMQNGGHQLKVAIGRDTRESGSWISKALLEALVSCEVEAVWDLGVITTPGLAFLTRRHEFDVGIMISASHNPYQDNGIKVFGSEGTKLSDEKELQIEEFVFNGISPSPPSIRKAKHSRIVHAEDRSEEYVAFLASHVEGTLSRFRVGLDAAHGAAFSIAPQLFRRLGAKVEVINDQPDGRNINHDCGSLHLDKVRRLVCERGLDYGVAFDGDADRSLFIMANGKVFDGDSVIYALSQDLIEKNQLKANCVVGTVMTNFALELALQRKNIQLVRAAVGDRYVLEEMDKAGANLGGEPSGHIILRDLHTTGDGCLTAAVLAGLMAARETRLEALVEGFQAFPQLLDGLRVKQKIPLEESPVMLGLIKAAEARLRGVGRVVRYSGTEPLLRIMAEGADANLVREIVTDLKHEFGRLLGS